MVLRDSINTASIKMVNSYKAYEWMLKNKETIGEDDDDYKKHFFEAQQIFSVVDILLRCFIIEKHIPIYKEDKKIYITEETDGQICTTNQYCCGILAYNQDNPDKQWLTDVDFSCFVGDNKKIRNLNEHLGVMGVLQDLYQIYLNLNKVCNSLDDTEFKLNLKSNINRFDYARFDGCMDEMNVDDRRYILLADSLHNVERSHLEVFLQIPWSVIFDFDGASSMGGLRSVIENEGYKGRYYAPYDYTLFSPNSSIKFDQVHIALCEDDFKRRFIAKRQDDNDNNRIPVIMDKIRDSIHGKATVVVTGLQTERVRDICKLIKSKFLETDIIFLTNQEQMQLLEKTEEDEWEGSGNISSVNVFHNSIFEAMHSIYENREIFLGKVPKELLTESSGYVFHTLDNARLRDLDMELLHSKEQFFEFLHLDIGNDPEKCNEWEFFHGDIVNWATIQGGYVAPLISADKVKVFEEEIKRNQSGSCYTIYHLPGFGGTTLGRIIAWDLHKEMPVVCLKGFETIQKLVKDIGDIYTHLFAKHRFLILIDENDFSTKQMQELEKMVLDSEYAVKALFVKRISESEAKRKQKHLNCKQEIVFSVLEASFKDTLKNKCRHLLSERGQEGYYEAREIHMDSTLDERQKYALIVNLYLLEEKFELTIYVRKFLDKLGKDSDGEIDRTIFAFIAMGEYFSNIKIPVAYIARYMDSSGKLNPKSVEKKYDSFNGLFLKNKMQGTEAIGYGIKHYLIALEMLDQILGKGQKDVWRGGLPDLVLKFIDFLCQMFRGMDKIDDVIKNIVTWLFTDKTKSRWHNGNEDVYESSFTSLLMELGEYRRIEIIDHLADKLGSFIEDKIPHNESRMEYKLLAHVYAQRARIRSKSQRLDDTEESQDNELLEYMHETMEVISAENICEYDLEHILGMCYLERAKKLKEKEEWTQEFYQKFLDNIDDAIERFNYAIWYGSPDYGVPCKIDAITTAVTAIIKYKKIDLDKNTNKLNEDDELRKYVDDGIKVIQDIDEYFLSTKAKTIAEKRKDEFEQACFPNETSEFLQRLNQLESKLSDDDYEGHYMVSTMTVYAYEKKHYSEEYRRSSLIHKALTGDSDAANDAKRVFSHLDKVVKMSKEHPVSYTTYSLWFEYAKYMQVPLSRAYEQAWNWKQTEEQRRNNISYSNDCIRPCYYLFVIQLLRYCESDGVTDKDVLDRKQDLARQISLSRRNEVVQDWYSNRRGLGRLYSREWIDIKNVDAINDIALVRGKVAYVEEEKCNYGYLRIITPNAINKWSKAPKGMRYNKDSDVYFSQRQSNIISERDIGREKFLKFGFSFDKLIASMNSLENRNVKRATVEVQEQTGVKDATAKMEVKEKLAKTSTKIVLGMQVECIDLRLEKGSVLASINISGRAYSVRIPKRYVKVEQGSIKLPNKVRGVVIALPTPTAYRYSIQPKMESGNCVWKYPDMIPFIPAGTEVQFKPNKITTKTFVGEVNGYIASINHRLLNETQKKTILDVIQKKEGLKVKVLETNVQGTGYVLYM